MTTTFLTEAKVSDHQRNYSRRPRHPFVVAAMRDDQHWVPKSWSTAWETEPRGPGGQFESGGATSEKPLPNVKPAGTRAQGFSSKADYQKAVATAQQKIVDAPQPTQEDIDKNIRLIASSNRAGGELRGNAASRHVRTGKLLAEFGNGTTCPCVHCGFTLDSKTLTQDKIYTAMQGGRYRMPNLLPACIKCNQSRNDTPLVETK